MKGRLFSIVLLLCIGFILVSLFSCKKTAKDNTSPVITLIGSAEVNVNKGTTYTDAGATAYDDVDGDITDKIVTYNPVDVNVEGTYYVTYNVKDKAGNQAQEVRRKVRVMIF